MGKTIFLVFLLGLVANICAGQSIQSDSIDFNLLSLKNVDVLEKLNVVSDYRPTSPSGTSLMLSTPSIIPTAFFCKFEHRLDKSTRLPLRMRLGDVQYVDQIEGKSKKLD